MNKIWYHGTNYKNYKAIIKSGKFKVGTWFAKDVVHAVKFGGEYIFMILIKWDKTPLKWQAHCKNEISTEKILGIGKLKLKDGKTLIN